LTYCLYPIFRIAGNDMAASLFAAYFIVIVTCAFSVGTIAALLGRDGTNRLFIGVVSASVFLVVVLALYPKLPPFLMGRITPGNSLRPLRAFLPYLAAVLTWFALSTKLSDKGKYALVGVVAGASLLWSNDFGIPTFAAMFAFALLWAWHTGVLTPGLAIVVCASALFAAVSGMAMATQGHVIDLLRYNFLDVGRNQSWYFGPWGTDARVFGVSDLFTKLVPAFGPALLVLLWSGVNTWRKPSLERLLLLIIGLVLAGGGALACVGGHIESGYTVAFRFWAACLVFVGTVMFGIPMFAGRLADWSVERKQSARRLGLWGLVGLAVAVSVANAMNYAGELNVARSDPRKVFIPELGGYLPVEWADHVRLARASGHAPVLEEYWGLWSAVARQHGRPPVDSLIHALGDTRQKFAAAIEALPEIVITTPFSMSPDWQPWNLTANYWFYKPLLENYSPVKTSPTTLVWRRSAPKTWPAVACTVQADGPAPSFSIASDRAGYYEISLHYRHEGSPRHLTMVRTNLVNAADADGYLSIDPWRSVAVFPVYAENARPASFNMKTVSPSPDRPETRLEACSARRIVFTHPEVMSTSFYQDIPTTAANLTDEGWLNGVFRKLPVISVLRNKPSVAYFVIGKRIQFADGETRHIVAIKRAGPYIQIELDGGALDGAVVGYPHPVQVLDDTQ
ncbi:MAG: hypothetical protein HGA47_09145, partial [Zoogloea sp.]|nr:hypothetical protein [Zoogloea sp.]